MGVGCTVTATGPNSTVTVNRCLDEVAVLERLWSRFIPESDLSRLNNAGGRPLWVDRRTVELLHHMIAAHELTEGAFNPALLPLQLAAGDDRSLVDARTTLLPVDASASARVTDIVFHDDGRVGFPRGLSVDAGGIAKGRAADLVVAWARANGADGVCVNIGGDMAIDTGDETGWNVDVLSPVTGGTATTVRVSRGGVATSAVGARHRNGGGIASHIFTVDGAAPVDGVVGATVIASTGAWAEAWTKACIVSDTTSALESLGSHGLAGMIVSADGSVRTTDSWSSFTP